MLQLLEEAHVLDRDHRLGGEGLQELDLLLGERPHLAAPDHQGAERHALAHERRDQRGPVAILAGVGRPDRELLGLGRQIGDVNRATIDDRAPRRPVPVDHLGAQTRQSRPSDAGGATGGMRSPSGA